MRLSTERYFGRVRNQIPLSHDKHEAQATQFFPWESDSLACASCLYREMVFARVTTVIERAIDADKFAEPSVSFLANG